jgi:hypothetical protein
MKTLGKIAFYLLFAFGAIRLFNGLNNLWPLLYGTTDKLPVASDSASKRYYRFDNIETEPMDNSQVIILIISGLLMIGLAFYIRKKVDEGSVSN